MIQPLRGGSRQVGQSVSASATKSETLSENHIENGEMAGKGSQICPRVWDPEARMVAATHMVATETGSEMWPWTLWWPLHTDLGLSCRAAAKISDGSQYYVLLIITDGVISDMTQTKEAIVSVSLKRKTWWWWWWGHCPSSESAEVFIPCVS